MKDSRLKNHFKEKIWVAAIAPYFLLRSKFKLGKKLRRKAARKEFETAMDSAPTNSIVLDCGANVGSFTEMFLNKGFRVHAFEPDPLAGKLLLEKFGANPLLTFHAAAVGIESGSAKLFRHNEFTENPVFWTIASSLLKRKICDENHFIEVQVLDFIEYIQNIPERIAILKMDIEGAEIPILERILDLGLHKNIGFIFVETHERISFNCAIRTAVIRARIFLNRLGNFNLDHN